MLTAPLTKKTTGRCDFIKCACIVMVTVLGMVTAVKLKTLSPAAFSPRATGSKTPLAVGL
jgi:hypothetical protein